ncbi:MAG: SRPBCC family protein [Pirellulaceae bacterium]|nr:SRPBCC family protein [Pirellulaceae bacterium]
MNESTKPLIYIVVILLLVGGVLHLIGAKEEEFVVSISIARPLEDVYPYLTNPSLRMKWSEGLVSCKLADSSDATVHEGTVYESEIDINGKRKVVQETVKLYEKHKLMTLHREIDGISETRIFEIETLREKTKLSYRYLQQRNFMSSFLYLVNHRDLNGPMLEEVEKLKQLAESGEGS